MVGQRYTKEQQAAIKRIIKDYPNVQKRLNDSDFAALTRHIQREIDGFIKLGTLKSYIRAVRRENKLYVISRDHPSFVDGDLGEIDPNVFC
jgi:hypothetical protein